MKHDISKGVRTDFEAETNSYKQKIAELNKALEELKQKQKEMALSFAQNSTAYKENTQQIKTTQESIKGLSDQVNKNIQILNLAKGSLTQNKALLGELESKYTTLSASQGDNSKQIKDLNVQIGHLTATIEDQEEKVAKSREVLDFQAASFDKVKDSVSELEEAAGPLHSKTLGSVVEGFNSLQDGLDVVKTGFQSVGGAIKATGFGLLMLVLQSLTQYFTETSEGTKLLKSILAGIGVVVEKVNGIFASLGKIIVDAVRHPIDSIKALGKLFVENITNRFKAFSVILDGIVHLDFKKVGDGIIQAATGVTNATDKIKKAYQQTKQAVIETGKHVVKAYNDEQSKADETTKVVVKNNKLAEQERIRQQRLREEQQKKAADARAKEKEARDKELNEIKGHTLAAENARVSSLARMAMRLMTDYEKEIATTRQHYAEMLKEYEDYINDYEDLKKHDNSYRKLHLKEYEATKAAAGQLKKEKQGEEDLITTKFRQQQLGKLESYNKELLRISMSAKQRAIDQLNEEYQEKEKIAVEAGKSSQKNSRALADRLERAPIKEKPGLQKMLDEELKLQAEANKAQIDLKKQLELDLLKLDEEELQTNSQGNIENGHAIKGLQQQKLVLEMQRQAAIEYARRTNGDVEKVEKEFADKKLAVEQKLVTAKIHAGDKYIDAVLKNTKKDSAIFKAAFLAKKATAIADVIMNTKQAIIASFKGYAGMPFIGQALAIAQAAFIAGQGALSIADIAKQKPGFAAGGQYVSDGRGTLLPGYSRSDNTNAYLRSGEAVVVSEAMRNPWARNLVSAINVAYGGRDFSISNHGKGYAIGGIFTDGGNANRYYSQPVNDVKDLANTLAYQMINNFPPVYVDVKDINTQQSILAKTVERVNL